ncbi:asparagine synthase (glutamine-hydrolyzing) [Pusillimonas sp. TS35]|uniref:asparagine synthase (glutamine-hydrolyzing) n=1 Tax=Paracandidimonas lactea TaxID=2895524 RepID=UPI001367AD5C|nr:asparagine synthase (glutamine-hydrolyzing) [Paracandidimonas lactea]MYN13578.1 asparagine synthase (glutamine-hydrolyzing) [Pusillimonas sp. TS35]
MCGIAGIFAPRDTATLQHTAARMAHAIAHRGPDGADTWVDHRAGLALGHRRLSIIDLSAAGRQPMQSACGRYVLVFNGEIYNHRTLRAQLEKEGGAPAHWRGHSDTETLLACFAAWGVEATLRATVGMFALGLWDRLTLHLTLARDRMGEKPLYWGWNQDMFVFGSELKALRAAPGFTGQVDRAALTLLMRHASIPTPYSIYEGIQKLRPGHYVGLSLSNPDAARDTQPQPYWTLNDAIQAGRADPFTGSADEAVQALEKQLAESVALQMESDVPLGAFLSGGVDSSTIVALMQAQSHNAVRTFTIGFDDKRFDEAEHARAVAAHLGTDHTEIVAQPRDALAIVQELPGIYDEPFADSSQIPTILVSRLARQHVTVALSGDAGDELFGGYDTYRYAPDMWRRISRLPAPVRQVVANSLAAMSIPAWNTALGQLRPLVPGSLRSVSGERMHKLASLLPAHSAQDFFLQLSSHWNKPERLVQGATEPPCLLATPKSWPDVDCYEHWMMAMSAQTYMTDDILVKVDRASMAASLEVRVPMLDHRVVELAWRMPLHYKIHSGQGKWMLRQVLQRYVPATLIDRPKMGFSVPLAQWLRGPLRDWAQSLLAPYRLLAEGYFDYKSVQAAWEAHLSGKCDYANRLWCILMFQAWLENEESNVMARVS